MIAEVKRYSYVQILLELIRKELSEEEKKRLEVIISYNKVLNGKAIILNSTLIPLYPLAFAASELYKDFR
ncbi:hypothetical protein [Acidianus ambivalens]|uniref:Uncharacterized protein n=1 Tax=Acidianus ambivalens TaxID=2283 RepID=A0A650CTQ8_ACIAM|nr:hypothetical protein [Acidianus ambivalens]MQL56482.1 hypothetical protein [Acidianus ambivalens]QGR21115.1 hypothetical protein D1866_03110 [Acidianus ambivalens]